ASSSRATTTMRRRFSPSLGWPSRAWSPLRTRPDQVSEVPERLGRPVGLAGPPPALGTAFLRGLQSAHGELGLVRDQVGEIHVGPAEDLRAREGDLKIAIALALRAFGRAVHRGIPG